MNVTKANDAKIMQKLNCCGKSLQILLGVLQIILKTPQKCKIVSFISNNCIFEGQIKNIWYLHISFLLQLKSYFDFYK